MDLPDTVTTAGYTISKFDAKGAISVDRSYELTDVELPTIC